MAGNTPRSREKNVTGQGTVKKRGEGLGTGPAGNHGGYSGRPGTGSAGPGPSRTSGTSGNGQSAGNRGIFGGGNGGSGLGKGKLIILAIIVIVVLIFGAKFLKKLGGGGISLPTGSSVLSNFSSPSQSTGWVRSNNNGKLDTTVAAGARDKRTVIKGDGTDQVVIMIYMCGTDLESKSGMATNDLAEMAAATYSDNVKVIVYTGGCKGWKTNGISNNKNQIYMLKKGGMTLLEDDMGDKAMTNPATLTEFIKWVKTRYTANRYELIFWDHGGGSLSGYGYDERFTSSGSMNLTGINKALYDAGLTYDFIGFDACLMATAENAIMLSQYADYLIASEETEPGIGWYYTNWLTKLCANPGMPTLEIGKNIVDDFTDTCASKLGSAKTTLSVIDLAELETTIPDSLKTFASSISDLIEEKENGKDFKTVSDARSVTREFSTSKIDQIDVVDFATRLGTDEGEQFAKAVLNSVKYNRTSGDMTNAYGMSIYFPYRKVSSVDNAVKTYDALDINDEYAECIKAFASLEVAGQVTAGGSSSALPSLLGGFGGSSSSSSASSSSGISSLLSSFLGGGSGISIPGLGSDSMSFLSGLNIGKAADYVYENHLDASDFEFKKYGNEKYISLTDEKWELVKDIELNVFIDDGEGFIDLGLDNMFTVEKGLLKADYEGTWLAINGQPVAYYHMSTFDDGTHYTITGRIPVLYNGEAANLIVAFTDDNPNGSVLGLYFGYDEDAPSAKMLAAKDFDGEATIDFVCDYYSYDGDYLDSYMMGDQIKAGDGLTISDVELTNDEISATYRITDIYGQYYWSSLM